MAAYAHDPDSRSDPSDSPCDPRPLRFPALIR